MSQVFISYSRKDLDFVERLAKDLKTAGLDVWYDLSGMEVGSRWGKEIENAIRQSQYFVLVLSPNAKASDWVENEFLFARNLGLKVIPLLYRACDLSIWLVGLNFIDVQGRKYEENFDQLLKALGVECTKTVVNDKKPARLELAASSSQVGEKTFERSKPVSRPDLRRWRLLVGVMVLIALLILGYILGGRQIYMAIISTKTPTPMPTNTPTPVPTPDPSIQKALYEIENEAPSYKTSFDQWEDFWQPIGEATILNKKLIASSQDVELDGIGLEIQITHSFAVSFDFRSDQYNGACAFMASNNEFETQQFLGFDLNFRQEGYIELNRNELPQDSYPVTYSNSKFDFSTYNPVTVIVLGDKIVVFINGRNAVIDFNPKPTIDYSVLRIGSISGGGCEFDNFKFWDLTGLGL